MQPQWKGSVPQKFYGGRKVIQPEGELALGFSFNAAKQYPLTGIKPFSLEPTPQAVYKPHMRTFDHHYKNTTQDLTPKGIKLIQPAIQPQRYRPQKAHIPGGEQTSQQIAWRGIKSFEQANKESKGHFDLEDEMKRKRKLNGLQTLRNSIGLTSMGDKSYKYPEYSSNFYQPGGLIPGSTQKFRKTQQFVEIKKGSVFTKPNADVKEKMDERLEEKKVLDSIDNWEQTILKQNNPKWNDPDTFFERQAAKDAPKDNKKGSKK